MAIAEHTITAERFRELLALPEYQDRRLELVEGKLVEMSKPKRRHGVVTMDLAFELARFVKSHGLGEIPAPDTGFLLDRNPYGRDTVRGIDIAFVSKRHRLGPLDDEWYEVAPDLAVEVISPGNTAGDIQRKVQQLLRAGTRLIWLVYPDTRMVEAHTPDGTKTFREDDTLSGGDVLPGFEIRVGDIFPG